MNREDFLKSLAAEENDASLRLVFANWLDDHGEHEEAARERAWFTAKQWLVRFAQEHSTPYEKVTYQDLIEFGRRVAARTDNEKIRLDESLWIGLKKHQAEFWKNWSFITGLPSPAAKEEAGLQFWQCCSHEIYYWYGLPDPEETDL